MKYKVLSLAILAIFIYSCASKSGVATTEVRAVENTTAEIKTFKSGEPSVKEKKGVATVMTPELAEGKNLYENNCAKCHDLYNTKDFTAEEWKPIVARMQKKAHLDDLTGQKIYNYVAMN